jgi:hypothetical protein
MLNPIVISFRPGSIRLAARQILDLIFESSSPDERLILFYSNSPRLVPCRKPIERIIPKAKFKVLNPITVRLGHPAGHRPVGGYPFGHGVKTLKPENSLPQRAAISTSVR